MVLGKSYPLEEGPLSVNKAANKMKKDRRNEWRRTSREVMKGERGVSGSCLAFKIRQATRKEKKQKGRGGKEK